MPSTSPKVPALDAALRVLGLLATQRGPLAASTIATGWTSPFDRLPAADHAHRARVRAAPRRGAEVRSRPGGVRARVGVHPPATAHAARRPAARRTRRPHRRERAPRGSHGAEVVYVVEERARHRPALVTDVGVRLPAHLTATGKSMLAATPAAQLRALYPPGTAFVRRTETGPADLRTLRAELDDVRAAGYATEDGAVSPGLSSVAVAVLDTTGWPVASVGSTYVPGRTALRRRASSTGRPHRVRPVAPPRCAVRSAVDP